MSSINGTCSSNSAQALFEQHMELLQQQRLEEAKQAKNEMLDQPTQPDQATGVIDKAIAIKGVTEPGKGAFIDFYI